MKIQDKRCTWAKKHPFRKLSCPVFNNLINWREGSNTVKRECRLRELRNGASQMRRLNWWWWNRKGTEIGKMRRPFMQLSRELSKLPFWAMITKVCIIYLRALFHLKRLLLIQFRAKISWMRVHRNHQWIPIQIKKAQKNNLQVRLKDGIIEKKWGDTQG